MIHGHGGNIVKAARELGCEPEDICDMSSNMNPLGPPPGLAAHLKNRLDLVYALPEPDAGRARAAFCRWYGLHPGHVRAGNGTTQFIHLLPAALKPRRVLVLGPTYSDYADACNAHGAKVRYLASQSTRNFQPDEEKLATEALSADLVFVCNPNNPTGTLLDPEFVQWLCAKSPGTVFVLDESYLPFAMPGMALSMLPRLKKNLVVLNSMSKIFRIPGLRIGFLAAEKSILDKLDPLLMPWSVNALAQEAVIHLEADKKDMERFQEKTRKYLASEKSRFFNRLAEVKSLRLYPSQTGFFLGELSAGLDAKTVCARMLAHRIMVRNCSNFVGLNERYIRIALKGEADNEKAARCLKDSVMG